MFRHVLAAVSFCVSPDVGVAAFRFEGVGKSSHAAAAFIRRVKPIVIGIIGEQPHAPERGDEK